MAAKKIPPPICETCGGTGAEPIRALGPFFAGLKPRTKAILEGHLPARRQVFEEIDNDIAEELVTVAKLMDSGKLCVADLLVDAQIKMDAACEAWFADEQGAARRKAHAAATALVFVLEHIEAMRPHEDKG